MQIQKENIRNIILEVARVEFFANGFKGASMRIIARKAGVGLSNIYNYYANKDEILCEVLNPLLNEFKSMNKDHNSPENISLDIFKSEEFQRKYINIFIHLIKEYRAELKLLLFHSHGSSLENFRDEYIDQHTITGMEYRNKMKEKYPQLNTNISHFFMHTISSWWLSIVGEIVTHDDLSDIEIENFISEYIVFVTGGWERLMDV